MCLQVALQTGARADMALTGLIIWQGTETGWKHILSSSSQHFAALPHPPTPPLPAHPTRLCILLINLLLSIQHETTSEEGVGVAFDHDIMLQPWQQLS